MNGTGAPPSPPRVLVVGLGIVGLALAWRLRLGGAAVIAGSVRAGRRGAGARAGASCGLVQDTGEAKMGKVVIGDGHGQVAHA